MPALTTADITSKTEYEAMRPEFRRTIMATKRRRLVLLGDHCSLHFENRDTMWYQVHEMLRAEDSWTRPGAAEDELHAYSPLVPSAGELSATMMLEYETPEERATELPKFVGIDRHLWIEIGALPPVRATFDRGQIDDRGVSSVQYVKWQLSPAHVDALGIDGTVVRLRMDHPAYVAQAVVSEETRKELSADAGATGG